MQNVRLAQQSVYLGIDIQIHQTFSKSIHRHFLPKLVSQKRRHDGKTLPLERPPDTPNRWSVKIALGGDIGTRLHASGLTTDVRPGRVLAGRQGRPARRAHIPANNVTYDMVPSIVVRRCPV